MTYYVIRDGTKILSYHRDLKAALERAEEEPDYDPNTEAVDIIDSNYSYGWTEDQKRAVEDWKAPDVIGAIKRYSDRFPCDNSNPLGERYNWSW